MSSPLTFSYRRADVAGFWVAAASAACAAGVAGALVFGASPARTAVTGLVAVLLLIAPGLVHPVWFENGIWLWNGSALRAARLLRAYALWVCYHLLFRMVSISRPREGSPEPPVSSGWTSCAGSVVDRPPHLAGGGAIRGLAAFAGSGRRWALAIVPVIALLAILRVDDADETIPGSTYTLY